MNKNRPVSAPKPVKNPVPMGKRDIIRFTVPVRYYYTPASDNTSMRFRKVLRFNNVKITVFFLFFSKKMCK